MADPNTPFEHARDDVAAGGDVHEAAARVVASMTPDEKLWCLDGDAPTWAGLEFLGRGGYHEAPFFAARVDRVGLPGLAFSDGPRGVVIGNATCFPVSMARGATWDPVLEERIGDAIGRELRASGANLTGAVCVNLLRHPAWGRAQETYGEDPHHVGEMGAALTRGIQRHCLATVKHFAVNSMENARFRIDVEIDDVALHEVYLPHFRRIVDEGVGAVMSAYNQVNGTYCGDDRVLLTDILRDEWGFEGIVISDWIFGMRDAAASLHAGLDIEMPYRMIRAHHLEAALRDGSASWDDVDASVGRIVSTLLRFDPVLSQPDPDRSVVASDDHVALAREVAARSVLLLRNEPIDDAPVLPIDRDSVSSIAVIGQLGDRVNLGDGGSSDVFSLDNVTVLEGIRSAAPGVQVAHDDGSEVASAVAAASAGDVAIVVVGFTADDEGEFIGDAGIDLAHLFPKVEDEDPELVRSFRDEPHGRVPTVRPEHLRDRPQELGFSRGGDRVSLRLRPHDEALIRAVASANARTVVIVQAGSAVVMADWHQSVPAVAEMWYGGQQAGHGLADVLFGDVCPSARLPFTMPADEADLPHFDRDADRIVYDRWHGWWRASALDLTPAYPFGFGLSYTTFRIGSLDVRIDGDDLVAQTSVTNTGDRSGADVVQVYVELPDPEAPQRLVGFRRVEVEPGATEDVTIRIPLDRLATRDPHAPRWRPASGEHVFTVARHVGDPDATTATITVP